MFIEHFCSQGLGELVLKAPCVQEGLLVIVLNIVLYNVTEVYRPVFAGELRQELFFNFG